MKTRHVYSTPDLSTAREVVIALRNAGIDEDAISVIARGEVEMDSVPDKLKDATTDLMPAAVRGVSVGGAAGLIAGLTALAIPAVGITVVGAGMIALLGAAVGGWSQALAGSSVPNEVRQQFESEIEAGRVLVVVDAEDSQTHLIDATCENAGAMRLAFEKPSALQ